MKEEEYWGIREEYLYYWVILVYSIKYILTTSCYLKNISPKGAYGILPNIYNQVGDIS